MQFEIEQKPKFESYSHLNSFRPMQFEIEQKLMQKSYGSSHCFRPMQFEIEQKPQNIKKIILKS